MTSDIYMMLFWWFWQFWCTYDASPIIGESRMAPRPRGPCARAPRRRPPLRGLWGGGRMPRGWSVASRGAPAAGGAKFDKRNVGKLCFFFAARREWGAINIWKTFGKLWPVFGRIGTYLYK